MANTSAATRTGTGTGGWWHLHPDHRRKMGRVAAFLSVLALCQFLAWAIPATRNAVDIAYYLPLHTLLETVSIVIAMMVFEVGWNSHRDTTAGNLALLATVFFAIACLDFSHTFSYGGMPDFITPNGPGKQLNFWIAARLLAAFALLMVTLRPWNRPFSKRIKWTLFGMLMGMVAALNWLVICYPRVLPDFFIIGEGLTPLKKNLEYVCIAMNLMAMWALWTKMRRPQTFNPALLFAAAAVMAMSEFYFTLYTTMTGAYNVLGHVYKVISYLLIYRAVVVDAIQRPYHELAQARTHLSHAVEASHQAGRLLQNTLDALPSLVAYWDCNLINRFANNAYIDYFGLTPESIKGKHLSNVLGPELYEKNLPMLEAVLRGETQSFERNIPTPDGSASTYTKAKYLPDVVDGKVQGFYAFVFDVTDIKATHDELSKLNSQLQQRTLEAESANAAKAIFLANMSHEIRTPMNAILGLLALLQNTELNARQRDYARKTQSAAQSLLGLLNDILDLSKVDADKMVLENEIFNFENLLRDIAVLLTATVGKKNIDVLFDIDPSLPHVVRGDAMRLRQILINLAGNAIKFTFTGQVVISMRKQLQTAHAVTIAFAVQDSGIGIDAKHQEHIFDAFSQAEGATTRRFGGTGLGLAISKRLVELMGGRIQVESQKDIGSTFQFSLEFPIIDFATDAEPVSRLPSAMLQRVLVVDDNPIAGDLIARMVRTGGGAADYSSSGAEALERLSVALAAAPTVFPYAVLCIDCEMPGMNGWELAQQIRAMAERLALPQPKITMVTASGRDILAQRSAQSHALTNGYVTKPTTQSMLFEAFAEALSSTSVPVPLASGRGNSRRLSGMRILVVEDNLINQQVAEELLSAEGAMVSLAANGQLGVDAVAAAAPQFDVVLMDIQMPVLDGYAATRAIRDDLQLRHLPIIAMRANAMSGDRAACLASGMNEHIGKPFDTATLVTLLVRITGFRAASTTLPEEQPAPPSQVAALPDIDGLELKLALARMSGSRALYLRTAQSFVSTLSTGHSDLIRFARAEDSHPFDMALHTLKGNAATLGLTALAQETRRLEHIRKQDQRLAPTSLALDTLKAHMEHSVGLLNNAIKVLENSLLTAPGTPTETGFVQADAVRVLGELESLLARSDMEALPLFAGARSTLAGLPDGLFEHIDSALQTLDFGAAYSVCRSARERLGR